MVHPGGLGAVEADDPDVAPGLESPSDEGLVDAEGEDVGDAHDGVAGGEGVDEGAGGGEGGVEVLLRDGLGAADVGPGGRARGGPAGAAVVTDDGPLGPPQEPDGAVPGLDAVLDGRTGARGAVDVDPPGEGGVVPDPAERRVGDAVGLQPRGAGVTVVGLGDDEGVDEPSGPHRSVPLEHR